mmetsp:Transcript_16434/g.27862  ORF Transcript_16434/g.27862 Transcript_16434/m.27862 type:complete len:178 (+) Transcript_16434:42-575(+)
MSDNDDNYNKQPEKGKYDDDAQNFTVRGNSRIDKGLVEDRGCTDFLCLILFAVFCGSMGYLTYYGSKYGDIEKLIAPLDGDKNFCGVGEGFRDYPKLYITDMTQSFDFDAIFDSAVCVKECPTKDSVIDCIPTSKVPSCEAKERYPSRDRLNYCFPSSIKELPEDFKEGWKNAFEAF